MVGETDGETVGETVWRDDRCEQGRRSVPAADFAGGIRRERAPFGAGLQAGEVGAPVGAAPAHELAGLAPAGVGEQQRGAAVAAGPQREGDPGADPAVRSLGDPPRHFVRGIRQDLHDGGRLLRVAEVEAEAGADGVLAAERPPGPPAGDAVGAGDEVVYPPRRGVDAEAVQDVGHCRSLRSAGDEDVGRVPLPGERICSSDERVSAGRTPTPGKARENRPAAVRPQRPRSSDT